MCVSARAIPSTPSTPSTPSSPVTPSTSAAGHEHCVDFAAFCVQVGAVGRVRSTEGEDTVGGQPAVCTQCMCFPHYPHYPHYLS